MTGVDAEGTDMEKARVAILGTGNIGTDLLVKVRRSEALECALFCGRNPDSDGIRRAAAMGVPVSHESVDALEKQADAFDIIFDATSAEMHKQNAARLLALGKVVIDLTPSKSPMMCIPALNLPFCLKQHAREVNLISCGGQANIPLVSVLQRCDLKVRYLEFVSAISSKSAGPATRLNIDEYILKTREAVRFFTGVPDTKVILNLNPAEPPVNMHNTIYVQVEGRHDTRELERQMHLMEATIRAYVPGYSIVLGPIYADGVITLMDEVVGRGDYLPRYAGNLDIMTCAAVATAEGYKDLVVQRR